MRNQICPICERQCEIVPFASGDGRTIQCIACGKYHISGTAEAVLANRKFDIAGKVAFAYWIYQNTPAPRREPVIDDKNLDYILKNLKLPSVDEQFINLINYLGVNTEYPSKPVEIRKDRFSAIIGSVGQEGAGYIMDYLLEEKIIDIPAVHNELYFAILTPKGWERYGEIKKGHSNSKEVFMAMQYGDSVLNQAFDYFKKAVKATGFDLRILDESLRAGLIDDQMRVKIRQSKFALVDLTHGNQGAYWEAGFAEGLGKQVIYLCERNHWDKNKTHFDTNHLTTVPWSMDTMEADMDKLKATIRASFPAEVEMKDLERISIAFEVVF